MNIASSGWNKKRMDEIKKLNPPLGLKGVKAPPTRPSADQFIEAGGPADGRLAPLKIQGGWGV
jgi:hypothetical protein